MINYRYQITDDGLVHISCILAEYHRAFDSRPPTADELTAWANEALDTMCNGSDEPYFEILSWDAVSGHTEIHHLNEYHYTTTTEDDGS